MADTLESIISGPSLIRERWLPPEMAVREVVNFERRFGPKHLWLACHAALPLIVTPELINLIQLNFLDKEKVPWLAQTDFLLSPLCRPIDEGLYEVEPGVREVLLVELENVFGWLRPLNLARFLLTYLAKKPYRYQRPDISRTHHWLALAYIDPDRVIKEMNTIIEQNLPLGNAPYLNLPDQIQMATIFEIAAQPLERTNLRMHRQRLANNLQVVTQFLYLDKRTLQSNLGKALSGKEAGVGNIPISPTVLNWVLQKTRPDATQTEEPSPHDSSELAGQITYSVASNVDDIFSSLVSYLNDAYYFQQDKLQGTRAEFVCNKHRLGFALRPLANRACELEIYWYRDLKNPDRIMFTRFVNTYLREMNIEFVEKTRKETILILIVDDNSATRDNLARLFYFEDDMKVVGKAKNGRDGVELASELKPHIVLMDINMPVMDGITATSIINQNEPYCQVIVISVQADQHYMKQAMAAGARDFQPKPFSSEGLMSCIRRVYNIGLPIYRQFESLQITKSKKKDNGSTKSSKPGEIKAPLIVVYSPKGGVGTSAVAANLAVALQRIQGDTVLLDGSFQFGDISLLLNIRPTRTIIDATHNGQLDVDLIDDVLLIHDESGLKALLAPNRPEMAEAISGPVVEEIVRALKSICGVIVSDSASKLNASSLALLDAADYILVVTNPDLTAIKSTKLFLELAEQLEFDPAKIQIVVNRAKMPGEIKSDQIKNVLAFDHISEIPYDPRMYFATNKGVAICQEEPNSASAIAITMLAELLQQKLHIPKLEDQMTQNSQARV